MDPRIESLQSTTFFGKRLTRKQVAAIQETVGRFSQLSRRELGHTICEHRRWQTAQGNNRIQLALRVVERLERLGILTLPALNRNLGRSRQRPVEPTARTAPRPAVAEGLAALTPLARQVVTEPDAVEEWNERVERYHPLKLCS